jgi:t-SNARE complex subunit (syntaxin)
MTEHDIDLRRHEWATDLYRSESRRLKAECDEYKRAFERLESKLKALFSEVERQSFDDCATYSMLNDLKTAIFNAIRRG